MSDFRKHISLQYSTIAHRYVSVLYWQYLWYFSNISTIEGDDEQEIDKIEGVSCRQGGWMCGTILC